jgi:acetyl-CoA synthetase
MRRMIGMLTGPLCGWPRERLLELGNERSPGDLPDQIITAFDGITDVALFYYVGHGQISPDDQLCLGLVQSRPEANRRAATSLRFSDVRQALQDSSATSKIVILDCCFAGLAASNTLAGLANDVLDKTAGTGAYTMAATSAYATAWYEDDPAQARPQTFFTKYLVDLVEAGIPGQPSRLQLDQLYRHLRDSLAADKRPVPGNRVVNDAREFVFAYNAAPPQTHHDPERELALLSQRLAESESRRAAADAQIQALQAQAAERSRELERLTELAASSRPHTAEQQRQLKDAIDEATRRLDDTKAAEAAATAAYPPPPARAHDQRRLITGQTNWTDDIALPEVQIAVHWREEDYYPPSASFVRQANANDPAIRERFTEDKFPDCFKEYAELLTWDQTWHTTLDASNAPFFRWFVGGRLNASYNCVDRHAAANRDKTAIKFVPELESDEPVHISYRDLYRRINEFAALLRDFCGVKAGDRVTLHMPMVPELPVAMLACARLGVIHSAVFGGFSGAACGARIADSGSHVLITMDGYYRAGQMTDHKVKADQALATAAKEGQEVDKVLVWRRRPRQYASTTPMVKGRDFFVDEVLPRYTGQTVEPVSMPAEAPLFLMYTSGTTGRPKGCQHSTGGYLSYVAGTSKYYLDIHPEDTYWCMADIGWITGHSYIVYGPLALGTTTVIYEGAPNYPDAGRPWRIAEQLGVNIFHTSPTAIRMLRKVGPDEPAKYSYRFKNMATVGEPIEPEVWRWYYTEVGKSEVAITDTWWQTETGGVVASTLPGLQPMKPGSCGPGALGIFPVIYDENGDDVPKGSGKGGNLCIRNPWPGGFQTIWGQPERFVSTYFAKYNKDPDSTAWHDWPYFAGDGAVQDADGYYRILGRVDDGINVAGHRLGTKELESAALTVPEVAEAAAVPVIDDVRGRVVEMYVSLKAGIGASPMIEAKVKEAIETDIGKIARPKNVWIVPDMPKTRSGTIMRRVIAAVANFSDVGDVTTLANPEVAEQIRHQVQAAKLARGEVGRKLTEAEEQEIRSFGAE